MRISDWSSDVCSSDLWEFTYGADRVKELTESMKIPFLCGNVKDTGFGDPVFESTKFFERGGVKIAVIGQAFPYTPIANPRYMIPDWSFGRSEERRGGKECVSTGRYRWSTYH